MRRSANSRRKTTCVPIIPCPLMQTARRNSPYALFFFCRPPRARYSSNEQRLASICTWFADCSDSETRLNLGPHLTQNKRIGIGDSVLLLLWCFADNVSFWQCTALAVEGTLNSAKQPFRLGCGDLRLSPPSAHERPRVFRRKSSFVMISEDFRGLTTCQACRIRRVRARRRKSHNFPQFSSRSSANFPPRFAVTIYICVCHTHGRCLPLVFWNYCEAASAEETRPENLAVRS